MIKTKAKTAPKTATVKAAKAKPAKAPKAPAPKTMAQQRAPDLGKRAAIAAAAAEGKLPPAPDFSAPTHARFRSKLDEISALVKAKDLKGLRAYPINPVSSSLKALDRYRNLAVVALQAQAKGA